MPNKHSRWQKLYLIIICCLKLPKTNCKIVLYGGKFWWGQQERKVHWITWNHLCKPKGKGCMYACMYVWVFGVIEVKSCFTFKAGEEANSKHNSLLFCIFFWELFFFACKSSPKKGLFCMENDYCRQDCPSERWVRSGRHIICDDLSQPPLKVG